MKTFQHFSPYNGLHWEPNGSRLHDMDILDDKKCWNNFSPYCAKSSSIAIDGDSISIVEYEIGKTACEKKVCLASYS